MFDQRMSGSPSHSVRDNDALGVIFDLDGVLIDSVDAHYEGWLRLGHDLGEEISRERFLETFGRQNRDAIPMLFGDRFSADEIETLGDRKEGYYRDVAAEHFKAIPGAVELVRGCRDHGFTLAVGSSGHPINVRLALTFLGIDDAFAAVVTGADVRRGKPHPDVFLQAATGARLTPANCAVIEDAPAGVTAAKSAGMAAIGLVGVHAKDDLTHADLVLESLTRLTPARIAALIRN